MPGSYLPAVSPLPESESYSSAFAVYTMSALRAVPCGWPAAQGNLQNLKRISIERSRADERQLVKGLLNQMQSNLADSPALLSQFS
ncbi:MAG TPA: hypothetical protein DEA96_02205 [Leptospiraceae bacterium]|nr:hypothetical protein [Spirochaetaceae bacterium]HBS03748.1 hypothetical protein [Leptospiraceae bacterium]